MNSSESGPGFELPAIPADGNESESVSHEVVPAQPESYRMPSQPVPIQTNTLTSNQPLSPVVDNSQANNVGTSQSMPSIADDSDLIEKEWVIKAKQIVAATKSDPYRQNIEMSKMKADYLKKRYNKDIKVEDS